MKTILLTYPGFQTLPRGIKQMLVVTENDFFSKAVPVKVSGARLDKRPYWQAPRAVGMEPQGRAPWSLGTMGLNN